MTGSSEMPPDRNDGLPIGPKRVNSSLLSAVAEEKRRRLQEKRSLINLTKVLEKVNRCYQQKIAPSEKEWPSSNDFHAIEKAITDLDPKRGKSRYTHPRWRYLVGRVDKQYPELLLQDRLGRFLDAAIKGVPLKSMMPKATSTLLDSINSNEGGERDGERATKLASGKKAFSIYRGEEPTGKYAEEILELCDSKFRELNYRLLRKGKTIPEDDRRFVEYAAALEVVRSHREFFKKHGRWTYSLIDFLDWSGYARQKGERSALELIKLFRVEDSVANEERRRKDRERQRKSRKNRKEKCKREM